MFPPPHPVTANPYLSRAAYRIQALSGGKGLELELSHEAGWWETKPGPSVPRCCVQTWGRSRGSGLVEWEASDIPGLGSS